MDAATTDRPRDIPAEARADFKREHFARVTRTIGDLNAIERLIRAGIETLQQHQQPAYRDDVTAVLGELAYPLGTYRDCPAIFFPPQSDSELAEELMILGAALQTREPRKWSAILRAVRYDARKCVVWFDLPAEECDPLSLDDTRRCA